MASTAAQDFVTKQHMDELTNGAEVPFARAKIRTFFQQPPSLGNQFTADVTLRGYLQRFMPANVRFICLEFCLKLASGN
jgi:hypothetical protein